MNRCVAVGAVVVGAVVWAGGVTAGEQAAKAPEAAKPEALLVHVGGTMRPAMEEICALFEKETGVKAELNYNDSGAIIATIQTTGKGDACVVHDPFPGLMEKKGMVDRCVVVASLTPVIAVPKGNPRKIAGVKDLARADVKVGLTDAVYSTGGHVAGVIFRKAGIAEAMGKKDVTRARSGGEVANAVKIGTLDAAVVWNAVVAARGDELEAVAIDPQAMPARGVDAITTATYGAIDMSCTKVAFLTLKASKQAEAARKLADFVASERGRAVFVKRGFSAAPAADAK
jgi:molybdate transport system substrate-binding protein